jgi:VanZ family protein
MCRGLTGCCVAALAVLSLLPGDEIVRTGLPTRFEHVVAYAGSATVAAAGYGARFGSVRIIGLFWLYAGTLEYLQRLAPGRHPAVEDFIAGALLGSAFVAALRAGWPHLLPR